MILPDVFEDLRRSGLHQPATTLFRAVELSHVIASGVLPLAGRTLDLGCGDGEIARLLARRLEARWDLIGVDLDPKEVDRANATGIYSRVIAAPADRIDEPDGSFDLVFSNSVLEHIPEVDSVLAEAGRLMRVGGLFVATVPSEQFPGL